MSAVVPRILSGKASARAERISLIIPMFCGTATVGTKLTWLNNGSLEIEEIRTGRIILTKPGHDGRGV